jgi:hypothetical protein
MGGVCTQKFLMDNLNIIINALEIISQDNTDIIKQIDFLKKIKYDEKGFFNDLSDFRTTFDNNSNILKILCGATGPSYINSEGKSTNICNDLKHLNLENGLGTMQFLLKVFDHIKEEQEKDGCVALEISQTPFSSINMDKINDVIEYNQLDYYKYSTIWNNIHNNENEDYFPLAFVASCIRTLPPNMNIINIETLNPGSNQNKKSKNENQVPNENKQIIKAIGTASNEGHLLINGVVKKYPCPYEGNHENPSIFRDWIEKTYELANPSTLLDIEWKTPKILVPHAGEEYYGDNGKDSIAFVNMLIDWNEENSNKPDNFRVHRLGHCCQSVNSPLTLDKLKKNNITCELCITSNNNIKSTRVTDPTIFKNPPALTMYESDTPFVICSDDPSTFSKGTKGCLLLQEYTKFTEMLNNAYKSNEEIKKALLDIANRSIEKSLSLSETKKKEYIEMNNNLFNSVKLVVESTNFQKYSNVIL